jgi:hypothetical protein
MRQCDRYASGSPEISVFAEGPTCCAVCAPRTFSRIEIELEVTERDPAASHETWTAREGPFPDGLPNPRPCPNDPSRRHWLLMRQDADPR